MYLSTLLIDVGSNPDRPRPGRLWLRNLYRVHQRLCMAFPSRPRVDADPEFLKPYDPAQFGDGQVHVARGSKAGFLFRVDPQPGGTAVILVLSASEPNWDYAFHNARHLLAGPPEKPRPLQLLIEPGRRFRFRLLANPTKRPPLAKAQRIEKKQAGEKVKRPRMQITWKEGDDPAEAFADWLCARAEKAGFRIDPKDLTISNIGYVYVHKGGREDAAQRLRSARYEGILEVTDADAFAQTLAAGIGPAKAFGFGLLSLVPVRV
jgi:CRISPR system Cascade subunit CasE